MPSTSPIGCPNPLAVIRSQIQDHSVRRAFDRVTKDRNTPWAIDAYEVRKLFKGASHDSGWVPGNSTTPKELEDLQKIRSQGAFLLRTAKARKAFDAELKTLESLPKVTWQDNDADLRSQKVAVNKVAIRGNAAGYSSPSRLNPGGSSLVSIEVAGKLFAVTPKSGESAASIVKRLANELDKGGYLAKVEEHRGISFVTVEGKKDDNSLNIRSLTTDRKVHMRVRGSEVSISVGLGAGILLAGGQVGLEIDGVPYVVSTERSQNPRAALKELREKIEAAGYEVGHLSMPGIDTIEMVWNIKRVENVLQPGTYTDLTGKITLKTPENPPRDGGYGAFGAWLKLDTPIRVGNLEVKELYLGHRKDLKEGDAAHVNGRLDIREGPAEIFPPIRFVELTGASMLNMGEPRFDGRHFYNAAGTQLPVLHYSRPEIMDMPSRIFVLDNDSGRVFLGSMGGFIPPGMNPFHGFRASAKIEKAVTQDRAAIEWKQDGPVSTVTGKPLVLIGRENTGWCGNDIPTFNWYLDRDSGTAYRFVTGGFGGLQNVMDKVIHLDPSSL
ncbi:hypothetical protein ACFL6C_11885 [Myxococcota bacterium]